MRHTTSIRGLCFLVCLTGLASTVFAQRPAREVDTDIPAVIVESAGKLNYDWPDLTSPPTQTQSGVSVVGDAFSWTVVNAAGDGYERHILVSGRTTATPSMGLVEHWKYNKTLSVYQLQSSYSTGAFDFSGVAWNSTTSELFLLDAVTKVIWKNTWNGTAALPTTAWTAAVTQTHVAELVNAPDYVLGIYHGATAGTTVVGMKKFEQAPPPSPKIILIDTSGAIPTTSTKGGSDGGRPYLLDIQSLNEGASSVTINIGAEDTSTYQLYHVDSGQVLGTATATLGVETLTVSSSATFVLGNHYLVKRTIDPYNVDYKVQCHRRYGFSETMSDGVTIGAMYQDRAIVVGQSDYRITLALRNKEALLAEKAYVGAFGIALRDVTTGLDPVVQIGSNYLLLTDLYVPAVGGVETNLGDGVFVSDQLDVPNDVSLIGQTLLCQAFVYDGGVWKVSEVLGLPIDGPPQAPAALTIGGGGSGSGGAMTKKQWSRMFNRLNRDLIKHLKVLPTVVRTKSIGRDAVKQRRK